MDDKIIIEITIPRAKMMHLNFHFNFMKSLKTQLKNVLEKLSAPEAEIKTADSGTYCIVNRVELADALAEKDMEAKYTEEEMYSYVENDPDTQHFATKEIQDEYSEIYDKYCELINKSKGGI
jgi:hypothetical protein